MILKYVFPDTNTFLHWPIFTDLDWHKIVSADEVHLIIPSIVLYEVEKFKDRDRKKGIQDRARKALKTLEDLGAEAEGGVEIRPGLRVEIVFESVAGNGSESDTITKSNVDSLIVEEVKRLRNAHPNEEHVIVTADSTMRLKARRYGIQAIEPPPDLRQVDTREETELYEVKKELANLKSRLPRPSIAFRDSGNRFEWPNFQVALQKTLFVSKRFQAVSKGHPFRSTNRAFGAISLSYPGENVADNEKYNGELQKYFAEITDFLTKSFENRLRRLRVPKLDLTLTNDGNAMASHVRVTLKLSKNLRFLNEEDFPEISKPPKEPQVPGYFLIPPKIRAYHYDEFERPSNQHVREFRFEVSANGKEAIFEIDSLVHHAPVDLPQIWVTTPDESEPVPFSISCGISCAELPKPVEQKLNVTIGTSIDMSKSEEFERWMDQRFETQLEERRRTHPEDFD